MSELKVELMCVAAYCPGKSVVHLLAKNLHGKLWSIYALVDACYARCTTGCKLQIMGL